MRLLLVILLAAATAQGAAFDYTALTNKLDAYWPMNETSGDRIDVVGGKPFVGYSAYNYGNPSFMVVTNYASIVSTNGIVANSVFIPKASNYVMTCLYTNGSTYNTVRTISFWHRVSAENTLSTYSILEQNTTNTVQHLGFTSWSLLIRDKTNLYLNVSGTGVGTMTNVVASNTWLHIVFDYSNGVSRLYCNATNYLQANVTQVRNKELMMFGGSYYGYHQIQNDDIAVWNRVLTSNEIYQIYIDGTNGISSVYKAWYRPATMRVRQVVPSTYPTNSLTNGLFLIRRINP